MKLVDRGFVFIRNFLERPVRWMYVRLPGEWRRRSVSNIKERMRNQYSESEEQLMRRAEQFLLQEGMLAFWGVIFLLLLTLGILWIQYAGRETIVFDRNLFGGGTKEVAVTLRRGRQKRRYVLSLREKSLSPEEEKSLKKRFFRELEHSLAGNNASLSQVEESLRFEETLPGWPFSITYEPENADYILLDGSLGDISEWLKERGSLFTAVVVTAKYQDYVWKKSMKICIKPHQKAKRHSPFASIIRELRQQEEKTRSQGQYQVVQQEGEVRVEKEKKVSLGSLLLLDGGALLLLVSHQVLELREKEKASRKETMQDFPVIVHLLTLYMGAGLSLASSIHRIGADYRLRAGKKKSYAFEELLRMDQQLRLGAGQQDICSQWGKRFQEPAYQKLSMTLQQVLSKGSREGRLLLEQMEQEAFRQRIAQAQREGEEASTKLLFPMIVLLGMVMVLVMFPAMLRFQGF